MAIFKTAYDTTAGKTVPQRDADTAIEQAIISGYLASAKPIVEIQKIRVPEIEGIEPLVYPKVLLINEEQRVYIDMRNFMTISTGILDSRVINQPEYDFSRYWSAFQYRWIHESTTNLRVIHPIAMASFSSWLVNNITKRLSLDSREYNPARIVCAFYFAYLFEEEEMNERDKFSIFRMIGRNLDVESDLVVSLLEHVGPIHNLKDLCDTLKQVIGSPRLNNLSPGFLIQIVRGGWFGQNAERILSAALEHPPTWLALITTALNNRLYKRTSVMAAIEASMKRESASDLGVTFRRAARVEQFFSE